MTTELAHIQALAELAEAYASRRPVRSVAVVGNAPMAPDADRAAAIDAADLVIRVNGFALDPVRGPPTVGSRVDVVLFNRALRASPWFFEGYRDRLYLMVEPGRLHWEAEYWPLWWPADLGYVVVSNRDVVLPLSARLNLRSSDEPVWATTGTIATWLAHRLFPRAQLRAAGMSFLDNPHQTHWHHAYGAPSPVGVEHVLIAEAALLRTWVSEGKLTVLSGH